MSILDLLLRLFVTITFTIITLMLIDKETFFRIFVFSFFMIFFVFIVVTIFSLKWGLKNEIVFLAHKDGTLYVTDTSLSKQVKTACITNIDYIDTRGKITYINEYDEESKHYIVAVISEDISRVCNRVPAEICYSYRPDLSFIGIVNYLSFLIMLTSVISSIYTVVLLR